MIDKIFRDKDGHLAIASWPNPPLWVWIVSSALKRFIKTGSPHALLSTVAFGSLFAWAWMELFDGVNYFRRALGFIVLVMLVASKAVNK